MRHRSGADGLLERYARVLTRFKSRNDSGWRFGYYSHDPLTDNGNGGYNRSHQNAECSQSADQRNVTRLPIADFKAEPRQ